MEIPHRKRHFCPAASLLVLAAAATWPPTQAAGADGQLRLQIVDSQTREPIPARVEFIRDRGRPVRMRGIGTAHLGTHFYLPGQETLNLRRGNYQFTLDTGPEYRTQHGHFEIDLHADDEKVVEMRRFCNLVQEGWWAGDLEAERASRDLPIVAATEGLHYAPTIAWRFAAGRWQPADASVRKPVDSDQELAAGRELGPRVAVVEREGGHLLLIADQPINEPPLEIRADATSIEIIRSARDAGLRVVAATPTAWELPVWIAHDGVDAVALLTPESEWKTVRDRDPTGRPRDRTFYPGKQGLARWGQTIYFHLLESGIRVPPVAGSGSGQNDSPLGTNRALVRSPGPFSVDAWWQGVEQGAVVVTNGPLVRPTVGGDPPGQVFHLPAGRTIDFQVGLNLASRQTVEYLEILKNGEVEAEVRLADWASSGGQLPPVTFDESGWFAVRAATDNTDKYQFALTAPYYVESPEGPRVSRASVEFFLAWLDELAGLEAGKHAVSEAELAHARQFWQRRLQQAGDR